MKKLSLLFLVFILFWAACGGGEKGRVQDTRLTIAVIPKGTTHEFWKAIHAGALKAAREMGVDILWKGPQKEDDRSQQITVVEDFISRGVDGIVLAPLDDRALMRPVRDAARENIPVTIIDSALQGSDFISFVATDNYQGGVLAAHEMAKQLPQGGKIILIRYQEGSASTTRREQGFLDTVQSSYPLIEYLARDLYAGATTESAYQLAENLLNRFPETQGIFCPNESSTFGTLRALQEADLAGKIAFIGFDSSPKLIQGLKEGHIQGLVLQDPLNIGYLGVKQMVLHLRGDKVEERVDTGVYVATRDNMNDPKIHFLLEPDLSSFLDR